MKLIPRQERRHGPPWDLRRFAWPSWTDLWRDKLMVGLVIHQWFPYFNRNIQYGFIYIYTYTYFTNNPNTSKHHLANGRIWEYLGPVQLVHWSPGRIDNVSPKHEKVKHHTPTGTPPVTAAEFLPPFQRFVSLIQFVSVIWVNHVNRCKPSYIYTYRL